MARLGILGLSNVGKTTLFNALTGLQAVAAPHPFSTTEPNVGIAVVPDERLDHAAALEGSAKTVHATIDLLDLPAAGREMAGRFMARLREMDAIAVVLRAFSDDAVPADDSGTDPVDQAERHLLDLVIADAEVFARRADKAAKEASADQSARPAAEALRRAADLLADGRPLRSVEWDAIALGAFRDLAPLTLKPVVWVVNAGEDDPAAVGFEAAVAEVVQEGDIVVVLSARLEEEGSRLAPDERAELFEGLGLGEGALAAMVSATYRALGLTSFYTTGPKEAHAWTVRTGATAREAAGRIHSDLERGFIRAEVCPIDDVIAAGGWDAAKAAGTVRVEGKGYPIAEGDVIVVRFSV